MLSLQGRNQLYYECWASIKTRNVKAELLQKGYTVVNTMPAKKENCYAYILQKTNYMMSFRNEAGPWWPSGLGDGVSGTWNVLFTIGKSRVQTPVVLNLERVVLLSKSYFEQKW